MHDIARHLFLADCQGQMGTVAESRDAKAPAYQHMVA